MKADGKKKARLNCIHHLLSQIPYGGVVHPPIAVRERQHDEDYTRSPVALEIVVPEVY